MARTVRGRKWLADVERIEAERNGIMGIFDDCKPPTGVRRYIKLVTKFVNENRVVAEALSQTPGVSGSVE
jgi:hypothetical protein